MLVNTVNWVAAAEYRYTGRQLDCGVAVEFEGEVWYWRGPSPFYFVTVPPEPSRELHEIVSQVTYGWGMVAVDARIGETEWYTALWPKEGLYVLPLKVAVRKAERIEEGQTIRVSLTPRLSRWHGQPYARQ